MDQGGFTKSKKELIGSSNLADLASYSKVDRGIKTAEHFFPKKKIYYQESQIVVGES